MPITSWTPENVYRTVVASYTEATAKATATAKISAPSSTGTLRRSIIYVPAGPLSGYIGSTQKYAAAQEDGARPHTIAPVRKKALYNKRAGFGPVKGPVQHPGNPGTGYLRKAVEFFIAQFKFSLARKTL